MQVQYAIPVKLQQRQKIKNKTGSKEKQNFLRLEWVGCWGCKEERKEK